MNTQLVAAIEINFHPQGEELMCDIEFLETLGDVKVDESGYGDSKKKTVQCSMGEWNEARLQVWGKGKTIAEAARECRAKVVAIIEGHNQCQDGACCR